MKPSPMRTILSETQSEIRHLSFSEFLTGKWRALSTACAIDTVEPGVMNALKSVLAPWGHKPIGSEPCYPSYVSADGFPAELSVMWRGGTPEIRVLFEPLGELLTPYAVQESGRAMVRSLAGLPRV